MSDKIFIIYLIVLIALGFINLYIYNKFNSGGSSKKIDDDAKLLAKLSILERKIDELSQSMDVIENKLDNMNFGRVKEVDELSALMDQGLNLQDIAKKKNVSVKEVELMLKMRDAR